MLYSDDSSDDAAKVEVEALSRFEPRRKRIASKQTSSF